MQTPIEKLTIEGVAVYVKREDLYKAPLPQDAGTRSTEQPPPPFAKPRASTDYRPSKLDYFAAKAMQGLVADKEFNEKVGPNGEVLARAAVKQADCLIAELNKELP